MNVKKVLSEELELISVSKDEILRLEKMSSDFIKSLKKEGLRAFVGGSLAKGTMVKKLGKQDVDIFVVFDYSEDILKLGEVLEKISLPGRLKKVHGSRDYFNIDCGDVVLEVIPVVKNQDPELAENVTDMSLAHVDFVRGEIEKNPDLAGEIMLAKTFCRANRCYGAEGYIRGFSGYSLEILVIYFGSFVNFLKAMKKIRVVDPMKYFKNDREIMREINSSKLQGPLVVVDPTYRYRNVCAGLGQGTFDRFLKVSKDFLKVPSLEFFERSEIDVEGMKSFALKNGVRFLELGLKTNRQEGDIAGTKMRKVFDFFVRELLRNGQEVLRVEFDYSGMGQKAKGYLVVKENFEVEVRGPSVGLEDAVLAFRKARGKSAYKKGKFWFWKRRVLIGDILDFVKEKEGEMGAEIFLV